MKSHTDNSDSLNMIFFYGKNFANYLWKMLFLVKIISPKKILIKISSLSYLTYCQKIEFWQKKISLEKIEFWIINKTFVKMSNVFKFIYDFIFNSNFSTIFSIKIVYFDFSE